MLRATNDSLLALFNHAVSEGFLREENRRLVLQDRDPARLLEMMRQFSPPTVDKWISGDER